MRTTSLYEHEEVKSSYTYPNEYDGPKPIKEQITTLAEILNLDPTHALKYAENLPELPTGAEGWFAIPSDDGLKKLFPKIEDDVERYCAGVRLVHEKIAGTRNFCNCRDEQITPAHVRVHALTTHALESLTKHQPGDILVVAAQLGMRHRGRSSRRARECFELNEFGLNSLAVGSVILTHPNRFFHWGELGMSCSGEGFNNPSSGHFDFTPVFRLSAGSITFDATWCGFATEIYGPASAFLP